MDISEIVSSVNGLLDGIPHELAAGRGSDIINYGGRSVEEVREQVLLARGDMGVFLVKRHTPYAMVHSDGVVVYWVAGVWV